jgi:hypothetical protein
MREKETRIKVERIEESNWLNVGVAAGFREDNVRIEAEEVKEQGWPQRTWK